MLVCQRVDKNTVPPFLQHLDLWDVKRRHTELPIWSNRILASSPLNFVARPLSSRVCHRIGSGGMSLLKLQEKTVVGT